MMRRACRSRSKSSETLLGQPRKAQPQVAGIPQPRSSSRPSVATFQRQTPPRAELATSRLLTLPSSPKLPPAEMPRTDPFAKAGQRRRAKPSEATNVSGSKTGEITKNISDGDTVNMPKVGGADAPKVEPGPSSAGGPAAGVNAAAHAPVPTKSVDQIVDAYAQGRCPPRSGTASPRTPS